MVRGFRQHTQQSPQEARLLLLALLCRGMSRKGSVQQALRLVLGNP
jgi:hypothetical protein